MSDPDTQHTDLLEYETIHRLDLERRFHVPGCPWGCDGSGWLPVHEDEDQTPRPLEVMADGVLYTPCECNMISPTKVERPFIST